MSILDNKLARMDFLKSRTRETPTDIIMIPLDKLVRSENNTYPLVNIEELADNIESFGLGHNLVVRPAKEADRYEIISGERRFLACKSLYDRGNQAFSKIPCKVQPSNDLDAEISLNSINHQTRDLTEGIKLQAVDRMTQLFTEKKQREGLKGRVRYMVAEALSMSVPMVGVYQQIINNCSQEIIHKIINGEMTLEAAIKVCKLPREQQQEVYEAIRDSSNVNLLTIADFLPKAEDEHCADTMQIEESVDVPSCDAAVNEAHEAAAVSSQATKDCSDSGNSNDIPEMVSKSIPAIEDYYDEDDNMEDSSDEELAEEYMPLLSEKTNDYWTNAKRFLLLVKSCSMEVRLDEITDKINEFEEEMNRMIEEYFEKNDI